MASSAASPSAPPIPFVVASWLGYPLEHIVAGLQRGSIAPPDGAPPGWLPPGAEALGSDLPPASVLEANPPAPGDDPGPSAEAAAPATGAGGDLRTTYQALVRTIDPSVADEVFDALWRSGGDDEPARAARVGDLLWRTVTGRSAPSDADNGDVAQIADAIVQHGTRGTLVSLAAEGSAAFAQRARGDPAVLGALVAMDAFAFSGVEGGDAPGRFDPATGEALVSDAWIDDRAKFVAWRQALSGESSAAQGAEEGWRFVDRTLGDEATVVVGESGAQANQVVFARDGGDRVVGGATVDRIHGGSGDDVLRGAAGDDLLVGAHGDDILSGGSGRDVADGGAGADEVSGGAGNDALDGGSGDDVLDGGRGDDTLRGGDGHDVYEFARGDGTDLVVDADGDGSILLDGEILTGDAAGDVSYVTHDDGAGGTTLVIRTGDNAAAGEIRIRDWREGLLGIRLEDGADAGAGAPRMGSHAPESRLKPLVTDGVDAAPGASGPSTDAERESGNESGPGVEFDGEGMADRSRAALPGFGRHAALDLADWTRATNLPGNDAALAPPDVDPGGVTAADLASALAGAGGDHDDLDAADPGRRLPIWPAADDWSSALVPPDAPPRPQR